MIGNSIQLRLSKSWVALIGMFILLFVVYYVLRPLPGEVKSSDFDQDTIDLKRLLLASIEAARRGGEMVKKVKSGKDMKVLYIYNV